ncbi:23S rRNA (pseudouridine(1915)-N(3))-methyltransferase RlmH [Clostridium sp.]|uniref:23S rRNA (pseudouridine(1915)-N(3))-methyltransferase RlmH n=1 Tax=Clostridium sp. TaxID=1506 RepID=UPI003216A099
MNFKIFTVGDQIEMYYTEAINEYSKRLTRYCKIHHCHVKNHVQLSKKIPANDYIILVTTKGINISSEKLANRINTLGVNRVSNISIIIGLNDEISCNEKLAISSMEMDLGLKSTVVFEQLYRAYRILNNEAYHK